jgi:RNA polymerase sigma-70 factor, ECF subfamily
MGMVRRACVAHDAGTPERARTSPPHGAGDVQAVDPSVDLVVRAKGGDQAAIERLWTLHEEALHVHLSRFLRDPRDVAEAAQEVFIRMIKALPDYELGAAPFRAWLFQIARNHAIDLMRSQKHSQVTDEERLDMLREATDGRGTATEGWLDDERTALAMSSLPVEQQRVLLLRFGFGFKSEEVARLVGSSPDAVRQQQSRALRKLESQLQAKDD